MIKQINDEEEVEEKQNKTTTQQQYWLLNSHSLCAGWGYVFYRGSVVFKLNRLFLAIYIHSSYYTICND